MASDLSMPMLNTSTAQRPSVSNYIPTYFTAIGNINELCNQKKQTVASIEINHLVAQLSVTQPSHENYVDRFRQGEKTVAELVVTRLQVQTLGAHSRLLTDFPMHAIAVLTESKLVLAQSSRAQKSEFKLTSQKYPIIVELEATTGNFLYIWMLPIKNMFAATYTQMDGSCVKSSIVWQRRKPALIAALALAGLAGILTLIGILDMTGVVHVANNPALFISGLVLFQVAIGLLITYHFFDQHVLYRSPVAGTAVRQIVISAVDPIELEPVKITLTLADATIGSAPGVDMQNNRRQPIEFVAHVNALCAESRRGPISIVPLSALPVV